MAHSYDRFPAYRSAIIIEHNCHLDWQESLRQELAGGTRPTNHARRVRSEPPRFVEDGLSFTNDGELAVYKMLKKLQASMPGDETIGIFPLAGGRLPGKT